MNLTINFNLLADKDTTNRVVDFEAIEWALKRAPSGGNIKPFVWSWDGNSLIIKLSPEYSGDYLNRNHHATYLTLGCLIESVSIVAAVQGYEVSYE